MSRFVEVVRNAAEKPIEAIQVIVAITVFILALWVASPIYVPTSSSSAVAIAFSNNILQKALIGLVIGLPPLPIILSLFFKRFNTVSWYIRSTQGMFICLLFLTLLRVLVVGWLPLTWVSTLGLALVLIPCYLHWKAKTLA